MFVSLHVNNSLHSEGIFLTYIFDMCVVLLSIYFKNHLNFTNISAMCHEYCKVFTSLTHPGAIDFLTIRFV